MATRSRAVGHRPTCAAFFLLVTDKRPVSPNLQITSSLSLLGCAVICWSAMDYEMFTFGSFLGCQCSKKKGTCLEREEVTSESGWNMYQKKVKHIQCVPECLWNWIGSYVALSGIRLKKVNIIMNFFIVETPARVKPSSHCTIGQEPAHLRPLRQVVTCWIRPRYPITSMHCHFYWI